MNAARAANTEPIPGYRLIEPLGSGGFGEVWKCEAPGGLFKAIKFVRGDDDGLHTDGPAGAEQELRALQRVKTLRHPFLLSMDRVEYIDGELMIVMELADRSLHDLLCEYRAAGNPGVPRAELLRYFAEAAEVLDLLNLEYGLQHLDVKPRNLFLVGRHVKVADFGLVSSLAELSGSAPHTVQMGGVTPVYAAPESFLGKITLFSDQYSLAIAYHELLVGEPPFSGKNFRQLALQHLQSEPALDRLPEADRPVTARALAKDPRCRYPSCAAFVQALESGEAGSVALPPASAPRRPKPATRTDVPVVDLTATPVVPPRRPPEAQALPDAPAAGPGRLDDAMAGFQFLECIARGPAGETWAARTPDGRDRLVRFFFGLTLGNDPKEGDRLARLRTLRHDALEPMEFIGGGDHRLVLLTDACAATLASRLRECQAMGLPGVPRTELVTRLDEAAEALDDLFEKHGLRHLGLTPRHLTLKRGRLRLLHFGLAELIHVPAGQSPGALNPRYAAPELFEGRVHPSSDAYSLALIYCELLTGAHPFQSVGPRRLASPGRRGQPDVGLAPAADRAALLLALHADPERRFPTSSDFIAALAAGAAPRAVASGLRTPAVPGAEGDPALTPTTRSLMRQTINGLVAAAAGDLEVRECHHLRCLLRPGRSLEHQFFARLPAGTEPLKIAGFREQWHAEVLGSDARGIVLLAPTPGAGWQRFLGLRPGLKVRIETSQPGANLTAVQVRIEPVRCGREAAIRLLEETGPQLLESLRTFLQALPDRRIQARLPFEQAVQVLPVLDDQTVGEAVASRAKDISTRGMGLYMPCRPPSMRLRIRLPGDAPDHEVAVPACVVRALPREDGLYEVGVRFLLEGGTP